KYERVMGKITAKRAKDAGKQASEGKKAPEARGKGKPLKRKADGEAAAGKKGGAPDPKKRKEDEAPKMEGKQISVKHGVKTDESKREQTVFVSNLDFAVEEDEVREAFSKFGPVV